MSLLRGPHRCNFCWLLSSGYLFIISFALSGTLKKGVFCYFDRIHVVLLLMLAVTVAVFLYLLLYCARWVLCVCSVAVPDGQFCGGRVLAARMHACGFHLSSFSSSLPY